MEPWKVVATAFFGSAAVFFLIVLGTVYALYPVMASARDARQEDGRYVVAPTSPPGTLWILDTRTGRVRGCTGDETTPSPTCADWNPN